MQEELSRLQRELNISFVMVTHDQSEALALSSCVAVFNQGRIEQIGTPREIYDGPKTPFVAKFIGRSNVLTGKVLEADSKSVLVSLFEGQKVICAVQEGSAAPGVGEEVSLCLKPEAVSPVVEGGADAFESDKHNRLICRLESSSYQGSLADLRLSIVGSTALLRATVAAQALTNIAGQDQLTMQFSTTDLRILNGIAVKDPAEKSSESAHAAVS
jgi:ABC-type Fe3+/spermidine/putrescine transport system ATPase subunit